ncbi:MAG: S8 family serine peptidase [Calditrichaeota bacterium]|nr:S8 family serine peptidase [Calditrichota bacterium]MCB9391082.1 S8 family serine peptidase [Calditrichota bacterium]
MSSHIARVVLLALLALPCMVNADFTPDELFVKLRGSVRMSALDGTLSSSSPLLDSLTSFASEANLPFASQALLDNGLGKIVRLKTRDSSQSNEFAERLQTDSEIEWVARNNRYQTVSLDDGYVPNDENFDQQRWLRQISAPLAWEITHGDSSIVIGIIDTGIDHTHRDLRDNIWHNRGEIPDNGVDDDDNGFIDDVIGWDFVDAPSLPAGGDYLVRDNDPMDDFGHGTYVAGCAAATTDNGTCYASVGFNCRLMPLRAGNANGTLEEDDIAAAVLYGTANGARIINMSFGDVVASPLLREVVQVAYAHGVVLTSSAGNARRNDIHYPSGFPEVISVGALDSVGRKANFSNYGPSVDIMAPGDYIYSTILGGECGEWTFSSGTSYAAPIVAGVAGLLLSINPELTPEDVRDILLSTAEDLGPAGWDSTYVNGRVHARHAVEVAAFGADAVARIQSPRSDGGVRGEFDLIGIAAGAAFLEYDVEYGLGENPLTWHNAAHGTLRVFNDILGTIVAPASDTILTVRLTATATNGNRSVDVVHLYVQNDEPRIDSLVSRQVLDADGLGQQILAWSNQVSRATLIMTNSAGDSVREDFGYVNDVHVAVIAQNRYPGSWTARLRVTNLLEEFVESDTFTYVSGQPSIEPYLFSSAPAGIPYGKIGSFVSDYDCDGLPEVWLLPVDENQIVGELEPYEWNGGTFQATGNTYGPHIPQAWGDADGDGLFEMAGRRQGETRVWEQSESCGVPNNIVFESANPESEFIISRFVVLDSSSGREEILARVGTSEGSRMALFDVSPEYSVTLRTVLPNETSGINLLGSPGTAAGDLDRDGRLDIFYGDYDGDLVWCEWTGTEMQQVQTIRLRQNDATSWIELADSDGDGEQELIVGCRSNAGYSSESQRLLQGWDYYIFESQADNVFAAVDSVLILGNENLSANPASVYTGDLDADGTSEIAISAYPDLYIVKLNSNTGRYEPVWYAWPSKSGGMTALDLNGNGVNELITTDGSSFQRYENTGVNPLSPFPPHLSGEPLNETSVRLNWTTVPGATHYEVYGAPEGQDRDFISATVELETTLTLPIDVPYEFAVLTYDTAFAEPTSAFSNTVTLTANSPPAVNSDIQWSAPQTISVLFSESMGNSVFVQGNWLLDGGSMPSLVLEGENRRRVYLSFDNPLSAGPHTLVLRNLRDAQGTALPQSQTEHAFDLVSDTTEYCHVLAHELVDKPVGNKVKITFSEPMSSNVLNVAHYRVIESRSPDGEYQAMSVRQHGESRTEIELELDPHYPAGAVGVPVRIRVEGVTSESGKNLAQTILLIEEAATDLSDAYVYPNPFQGTGAAGSNGVFFAGLPTEATIRIFSANGALLRKIDHKSSSGHAEWDLRTDDGERVASGIYIFTIESAGAEKTGKLAIAK